MIYPGVGGGGGGGGPYPPSLTCVCLHTRGGNNEITLCLLAMTFCHLLITFANNLDTDQAGQVIGPDLDPNSLTL